MENRTLYDVGCSYPELCRKNSLGVGFGKRSGDRGHLLCHRCCDESECNAYATCDDDSNDPSECADILFNSDGVFNIYPKGNDNPVPVYCKLENGTKWTVIQRRTNGSVDFYKTWNEYKKGFGNVHGEYWLGNDVIHNISSNGRHKLRIFLGAENGTTYIAEYSTFRVGDENTNYLINVTGYSGSADKYPRDHNDVRDPNCGLYRIYPSDISGFETYCDMTTEGGGWLDNAQQNMAILQDNYIDKYVDDCVDERRKLCSLDNKLSSEMRSQKNEIV
ncbi:unnamed protein product [Mytilus coruscus]|uniref:Fibrinogen C-terminal domain-containing protein n=1 Tax=Mytilus coruscus TaxID=42192 RepID=A0A6J8DSZ7_MYTCO|nr:unnamed protein product [Mytilus coruscus]